MLISGVVTVLGARGRSNEVRPLPIFFWGGGSARGLKIKCLAVGYLVSNKCISVRKVATPLRELACHMGSHSVTCHPAEVTFPPFPQPKLVLD